MYSRLEANTIDETYPMILQAAHFLEPLLLKQFKQVAVGIMLVCIGVLIIEYTKDKCSPFLSHSPLDSHKGTRTARISNFVTPFFGEIVLNPFPKLML